MFTYVTSSVLIITTLVLNLYPSELGYEYEHWIMVWRKNMCYVCVCVRVDGVVSYVWSVIVINVHSKYPI